LLISLVQILSMDHLCRIMREEIICSKLIFRMRYSL
jgi:hypothetical protein